MLPGKKKKKRKSFLSMIPTSYNNDWPDKIYLLMQYEYYESNQTIFWVDLKPVCSYLYTHRLLSLNPHQTSFFFFFASVDGDQYWDPQFVKVLKLKDCGALISILHTPPKPWRSFWKRKWKDFELELVGICSKKHLLYNDCMLT